MSCPKMNFCHLTESVRPFCFDQLFGDLFYICRHPALQTQSEIFALTLEPINKRFAGQDRCGRHGDIRFGFRALFKIDLLAVPQQ